MQQPINTSMGIQADATDTYRWQQHAIIYLRQRICLSANPLFRWPEQRTRHTTTRAFAPENPG